MDRIDQKVITAPAAAALLLDEEERAILGMFFAAPKTVSSVANALKRERVGVLYRVRKLLKHDLLHVARLEPRAGRPIKHYQTSAERFVVPYGATRAASPAEFVELLESTFRQTFYESFLRELDENLVGLQVSGGEEPTDPDLQLVFCEDGAWRPSGERQRGGVAALKVVLLRLPEVRARAFKHELLTLVERYRTYEEPGDPPLLLRLGLVRLKE